MKLFIKYLLVLLLSIGSVNLYAQKAGQELIDSLLQKVPKESVINKSTALLFENIGMAYNYQKDYNKAKEYFSRASEIYEESGNKNGVAQMALMNNQMDLSLTDSARKQKEQFFYIAGIVLIVILIGAFILMYRNQKKMQSTNKALSVEKKKSEDLILNILPAKVVSELQDKGMSFATRYDNVTVVFTDFVSFTKVAERFSPEQLVGELHSCFKAFDALLDKYNMEKIKTIGDAYLAVSGLPANNPNHATDAVAFAKNLQGVMAYRKTQLGDATFEMRVGVHTGSVIAGIVGTRKFAYDIWGDTVNTAARIEQNSKPGMVNISQTTHELVKTKFPCEFRGEIEAKGKGKMNMYFVS